jgi:hypothetical protein
MSNLLRIAAIALSLIAVGAGAVSAQDNSSTLAQEGLPELHIVVTDGAIQAPAEAQAGLAYVTLDNQTMSPADAQFAVPSEGTTLDDIMAETSGEGLPDWFYDTTFAGGPYAEPGKKSAAVVDLSAGDWIIANTQDLTGTTPAVLKVTGDADAAESGDVDSDLKVTMKDHKFDLPDEVDAGTQVWEVTNKDSTPHFIYVLWSPTELTDDDVGQLLSFFTGTPVASFSESLSSIVQVGYVTVLTKDEIAWQEMNLQPGYYLALCLLSDKGSTVPHAAMGMIDTFHVPGEIVTPTPGY